MEGGREGGRFSFQCQHIVIEDINITLINRLLKPCVGVTQWIFSKLGDMREWRTTSVLYERSRASIQNI